MSFSHEVDNLVQVIEGVGVGILMLGGAWVLVRSGVLYVLHRDPSTYAQCRRQLSHVILLGLEVLIIADIIRTVIVDQTPTGVATLAVIVVVRILLSFSLAVEVDGMWPWQRYKLEHSPGDSEH